MVDVCMEPMFWFVDNFTKFLGPVSINDCHYSTVINLTAFLYHVHVLYELSLGPDNRLGRTT
jgi:hypothetical protein